MPDRHTTGVRPTGSGGEPTCLVLMPMYAGFEAIRACVARAVRHAGFEMRRLEVEIEDSAWHLWLLDSIEASDVVLADLTGHNPFVMYELGYAHHRQLPTGFIVRASDERVPATVRGAVCLPYGEDCPHFERDLVEHLRHLSASRAPAEKGSRAERQPSASELYRTARTAAAELERATGRGFSRVDETEFRRRLTVARRRGDPGRQCLGRAGTRHLLALVLEDSDRVDVMRAMSACGLPAGRMATG